MGLRTDFVHLLQSQVGYHEGKNSDGWDNIQKFSEQTPGLAWSDGQPWCATFECWGAWKTGLTSMWPMTASCATAVAWWKDHGRFSEYPVLGGPLYMGAGGGEHTEVVTAYTADTVTSVGGNTNDTGSYQGDGVYRHTRPRRGTGSPYGYGVPAYPEGTVSADPALGGTPSASVPAATPAAPTYEPFPGTGWFALGRKSPIVAAMHARLVAVGCNHYQSSANKDVIGSGDVASYQAWQRKCGYTGSAATWPPGKTSWDKLHVPNV